MKNLSQAAIADTNSMATKHIANDNNVSDHSQPRMIRVNRQPLEETTAARNENSATVLLTALHAALEDGFGEPRPGATYILAVAKDHLRDMFVNRYKANSIDTTDAFVINA